MTGVDRGGSQGEQQMGFAGAGRTDHAQVLRGPDPFQGGEIVEGGWWHRGGLPHPCRRDMRDYFPKGIDLRDISPAELERVAAEINNRPRKTLGWARPAQLLAGETQSASA